MPRERGSKVVDLSYFIALSEGVSKISGNFKMRYESFRTALTKGRMSFLVGQAAVSRACRRALGA